MSTPPDDLNEVLQTHVAWLRRLAQRLVADAHAAEDLAQETWVAALGSGATAKFSAASSGSLRAFLAGVLRRRVLQLGRREGRRRGHELAAHGAVPGGDGPQPEDALERAELGQRLTQLVFELEPPFRDVILLCYYSELSPRDIARRLSLPVKTVESRLSRGRQRLRESWKRDRGDSPGEANWLSSLAVLALPEAGLLPPMAAASTASFVAEGASGLGLSSLGVLLINTKLALFLLLAIGSGGLFWLVGRDGRGPLQPPAGASEVAALQQPVQAPPVRKPTPNAALEDERRGVVPGETGRLVDVSVEIGESAPLPENRFFGRVVDPENRPLAEIAVAFDPVRGGDRAQTVSDGDGYFEILTTGKSGRLHAIDGELENLFVFHVELVAEREMLLVLAPRRRLSGRVEDPHGNAIAGVPVAFELPAGFRTRFRTVLDGADDARWEAVADEDGRFRIDAAPVVAGSRVVARLEGHLPGWTDAPESEAEDLVIVLERGEVAEGALLGRVVDAEGEPAGATLVSLGRESTLTAADGTFHLDLGTLDEDDEDLAVGSNRLRAVRAGSLPGEFVARRDAVTGAPEWPDWVELRLGGEPLELSGVVVDAEGNPRPGVKLWISDPTVFGVIGDDLTAQLENLVAPTESTYEEGSDAYFRTTQTDEAGRFRLQGLLEREYSIGLLDRRTLGRDEAGPFAAGRSDLRIALPAFDPVSIRGRLVSRKGLPIEGAQLVLHAALFGGVHENGARVTSDAEGSFHFENVARGPLSVWVRGDRVAPSIHTLDPDAEDVELVADALCHIRLEAEGMADKVDGFHVLAADGERLAVYKISAHGSFTWYQAPAHDGTTSSLGVPEHAATVVLTLNGREVESIPIFPRLGELYIVRP